MFNISNVQGNSYKEHDQCMFHRRVEANATKTKGLYNLSYIRTKQECCTKDIELYYNNLKQVLCQRRVDRKGRVHISTQEMGLGIVNIVDLTTITGKDTGLLQDQIDTIT